jgi:chromosome segregation ATPase
VKEMKSNKLTEIERRIAHRQTQDKHEQQEFEQLVDEQQCLKKTYNDALAQHEQLQHTIDADRQIVVEMKNESARLREQIQTFVNEKETLDDTCDLLAKKIETLHNECEDKEVNLRKLIAQIDEKLSVCKNLEDETKKLHVDKTRCLEEVTEMKEKLERKRLELRQTSADMQLERQDDELKQRIQRHEIDLNRINRDIDERNRTLNELNSAIAYAKTIIKVSVRRSNVIPLDEYCTSRRYRRMIIIEIINRMC